MRFEKAVKNMTQHTPGDIRSTIYDKLNEFLIVLLLTFTPFAYGG